MRILQGMDLKFCVKFQRAPLKFHTKFLTNTPQNMLFTVYMFVCDLQYLWIVMPYALMSYTPCTPPNEFSLIRMVWLKSDSGFTAAEFQIKTCSMYIDKINIISLSVNDNHGISTLRLEIIETISMENWSIQFSVWLKDYLRDTNYNKQVNSLI